MPNVYRILVTAFHSNLKTYLFSRGWVGSVPE